MDIITRRLWIIRQVLATTDEALLKKIEYLLLTDGIHENDNTVNEPTTIYLSEADYSSLPEDIVMEIKKLAEKPV